MHGLAVPGDGVVDLVAENDTARVAIEVETGKSDVAENVRKSRGAGFNRIVLFATSPTAVEVCQRVISAAAAEHEHTVQLLTWLDAAVAVSRCQSDARARRDASTKPARRFAGRPCDIWACADTCGSRTSGAGDTRRRGESAPPAAQASSAR